MVVHPSFFDLTPHIFVKLTQPHTHLLGYGIGLTCFKHVRDRILHEQASNLCEDHEIYISN